MNRVGQLMAFWMFNIWLYFALISNPAAYQQWRAAGVQWYICMEHVETGVVASDQCTDSPPTFDPSM